MKPNGAIVVVAKCPIPGKSKTRLSKSHLLSQDGAALLAKSMLSDILTSLSSASSKKGYLSQTLKVLLYAPGDEIGEGIMMDIFKELNLSFISSASLEPMELSKHWILLPMLDGGGGLHSSDLGGKLADALHRVRGLLSTVSSSSNLPELKYEISRVSSDTAWSTVSIGSSSDSANSPREEDGGTEDIVENGDQGGVLFLGMDSPELPLEEIIYALTIAHPSSSSIDDEEKSTKSNHDTNKRKSRKSLKKGKAHLCPANDGGYGMLCLPSHANPHRIFSGIRWSQSLTAISQLKALSDENINVSIGKLMHDVDEPEDVRALAERLCLIRNHKKSNGGRKERNEDVLECNTPGAALLAIQQSCNTSSEDDEGGNVTMKCPYTWDALMKLELVKEKVSLGRHHDDHHISFNVDTKKFEKKS